MADKTFKNGHVTFWELKADGTWAKLPGKHTGEKFKNRRKLCCEAEEKDDECGTHTEEDHDWKIRHWF